MDPLAALRDIIKAHQTPTIDGEYFVFGDYKFHKSVPTGLVNSTTRQPYSLESLNFVIANADTPHTKYLLACSKAKIGMITLADKKDVIAYLKGEIDTCASLATEAPEIDPSLVAHTVHTASEERNPKRQKVDTLVDLELDDKLLQEKQEIASRLDAPKVKTTVSEDMALLGSMTKDQIEAIKLKRLRTKMANITTSIPKKAERSSGFVEADAAVTRRIVDRERLLSTRTSILNTNNKKHFTDIINAVTRAVKVDSSKSHHQQQQQQKVATYDRYNVQEDKNWWKDKLKANDLDDFQIDTRGTFADGGLALPTAVKNPGPSNGSSSASSSSVKATPSASHTVGSHSSASSVPKSQFKHGQPIIIVPSAVTSLITSFNVKHFLEDGKYPILLLLGNSFDERRFTPTMELKSKGAIKAGKIEKKLGQGLSQPFQIIDSTTKLSSKDWSRVVAVFVLGQAWQFKDWHWPSPVEVFSHVRGFYLKYDDDALPADVKSWSVKILTISKSKRHLDQTAALQFWNELDDFLLRKH